jgi:phage shock protein A
MGKAIPLPKEAEPLPAALEDKIRESIVGVEKLRAENAELHQRIAELEYRRAELESEIACLKAQYDCERTERRHYHSLCTEIITRLDIVGRTVDDVVKRAEEEVYRQRRENPRADLPELKIPEFLARNPTVHEHVANAEDIARAA